ncbi:JDVT-CTERM system glutamic-type intramembrane protease [Ideonella sp. B508-1]|uniref:JDVT-CTERM system glutamic-type intramembrane protease MrtJ n=1 Tax=Ideonella sp. B508-1 TaxID=137716 RepID=UPI00034B4DE0|nr:JDVT-CTERM system glutamic-type intramembrane protease [Ideonella sp. B508-1]
MAAGLALGAAPVLEETVFRAGLQDALLRRGASGAVSVLLTAGAFALAHALWRPGPWAWATALPALLLGGVYLRTRRLWPCIALHALFNALWWGLLRPLV